jgi:hypothetical protein
VPAAVARRASEPAMSKRLSAEERCAPRRAPPAAPHPPRADGRAGRGDRLAREKREQARRGSLPALSSTRANDIWHGRRRPSWAKVSSTMLPYPPPPAAARPRPPRRPPPSIAAAPNPPARARAGAAGVLGGERRGGRGAAPWALGAIDTQRDTRGAIVLRCGARDETDPDASGRDEADPTAAVAPRSALRLRARALARA